MINFKWSNFDIVFFIYVFGKSCGIEIEDFCFRVNYVWEIIRVDLLIV